METLLEIKAENPLKKANIFGKIFFTWTIPYFKQCIAKQLDLNSLFRVSEDSNSKKLGDLLEKKWLEELTNNKNPSIIRPLCKIFIKPFLFGTFLMVTELIIFRTVATIALLNLINLFRPENVDKIQERLIVGAIYSVSVCIFVFFHELGDYWLHIVGKNVRIGLSSLVYRKLLRLNLTSLGETSSGAIINLLATDINKLIFSGKTFGYVFASPLYTPILFFLLWQQVGIASLSGIFFLLLTIPILGVIGKLAALLRSKVAKNSDSRTKLLNEIVSGIKVIKMYAWEKPFENLINKIRDQEMVYNAKSFLFIGFSFNTHALFQKITVFLIVITLYFTHESLSVAAAFSTLQYVNLFRVSMVVLLPMAIKTFAEAIVTFRRLHEFLLLPEVEDYLEKSSCLTFDNFQAQWAPTSLRISIPKLEIPDGQLCAVVGSMGSGKSSLLHIILGELKPFTGKIKVPGKVSYSSQEPWLFCSSIRQNILFGEEFCERKYKKVVSICSLNKDFDQLPNGDQCLVGEKGVMLSGGQRARVNLARAIYKEADLYLLDDPLSAVDAHVGRHIFEECIMRYLNNKTVILVTHQLQYLKEADLILVLNDGRIEAKGTYQELKSKSHNFTDLLEKLDQKNEPEKDVAIQKHSSLDGKLNNEFVILSEQETIIHNLKPFREYIKEGGSTLFILLFFLLTLAAQGFYSAADYFLVIWTKENEKVEILQLNGTKSEASPIYILENTSELNQYLIVYAAIIILSIILTLGRVIVNCKFVWNASKNLHTRIFNSLLKAPMIFFNKHSSGQILNRFSKDMGVTDQELPFAVLQSSQLFLVSLGNLVLITFINWYMIIFVIFFCVFLALLFKLFVKISSQIQHLEGITKSPIFTHVNYSLLGLTTIRSTKNSKLLIKQFDNHQDIHTSADFLSISSSAAFAFWSDILCGTLNVLLTFALIFLNEYVYKVSEADVGLALSQAISMNILIQYSVKRGAETVNHFTSVERLLAYTKLDEEPIEAPTKVNFLWPYCGGIKFEHVSMRYDPKEEPVLKNINFVIQPREKIGVVGRTGAGKSSLVSALFRLGYIEGVIVIDGVKVTEIGLNDLRKTISIIPQEPVLFSETIRYNLDPFREFEDEEIWKAIGQVEMKDFVENLDCMIHEGGSNYSIGQRQLLCLARALLRRNKILVLDEATANVDLKTDELIQNTIKTKLHSCTVITIAHRLNTIMDCDKVMVMHNGELVEFDHPHLLLKNEKSLFYSLVAETGVSMMQELKQVAQNEYLSKKCKQ